ncbi:hypothetical protein DAPPUDRAFT_116643 [Daphnia pulex]|uniref:Uncharacterized protein n=1 Tax=Daphnia pulex TaxID=6669 RepID=E9HQ01_DAPPU|nr:hypothetical protein DAPPUDRAFT_116643 [Daphnia pulex]|eukprot:EFX66181.1 hypothetical protein DAPPUDRAFT_116643 [Daphnia pulex]
MSRPPSDFFRGRFFDPRVNYFDQPVSERERMRDREMRIRSHLQHPGYQFRERSPVGFSRQWDGFGFVSPFEDHEGRFYDHRSEYRGDYSYDPTFEYNNPPNDRRQFQGYYCGDKDFYFFSEDGLCYDAQGVTYRFEEDGFYYDVVTGVRHDSGGFACDEKGVRIGDNLDTSDEDLETDDPPPQNKTVPPPSEKSASPKGKAIRPSTGKSVSFQSEKKTPPRKEQANAGPSAAQNQDELNSDQTRRSRPWRPSSMFDPVLGEGGGSEAPVTAPVAINPTPTVAAIPVITIEGVSLPGGSGSQPLSVSKDISEEISSLMTKGISTDTSKAISGEFPLEFVDAEFSLKPPKLDGWISRRALLKTDKSIVRSINAAEESFTKAQLRIMDIAPPLIDLYARLNSLPDSESLKRPVQAALQQWGRAFFHVTKERRSAAIALAEPGAEYLLRDPDAFESGKEARSFLFTERYLQAMLTDANQDNTLAQAARATAAAAAARVPKRSNPKRGRVDQPGSQFPPPRYGTDQMGRGGRGGRGRNDRGRGQPANPWLQGGRRYVAQNSKHLPPCKTAPQSHLVPHAQTKVPSNPVGVSWPHTGPQAVAARLKLFAARWPAVTSDQWVLEAVREGITIDFVSEPIQKFLPPQITMSVEMSAVCDAEVRELLSKRAISESNSPYQSLVRHSVADHCKRSHYQRFPTRTLAR